MNICSCVSSLAVLGLIGTLEVSAAEISSLKILAGDTPLPVALDSGISIAPKPSRNGLDERELSTLNLLGIRYAKGEGVKKNPGLAMRFFLRSAMRGYTPAMANVGTLYEIGATGHANLHRAYAWVRAALAFGVPEEDHDSTLLKLGMIAERLGSDNIGGAERLAGAIAGRIVDSCQCSPGQETALR